MSTSRLLSHRSGLYRALLIAFLLATLALMPGAAFGAADPQLVTTVAEIDRARILRLAADALKLTPPAITDHRATNSQGGPHDFYSNGDYYWPNPATTNGLPYVGRDGNSNPGNFDAHRIAMRNMKDAVAALAAAYAITGDDQYPPKAAELIKVFFLDDATKMNPNLDYAQAVLGKSPGNPFGVIDTLHLAELPVAVRFLEKSSAFDPAVDKGLRHWFNNYITWMTTATNGVKEMNAANNHSIAYFVQLASFARFTGCHNMLELSRSRFKQMLLAGQMAADGSFPRELHRTKPYGYSIFQADNVAILCVLLSTPKDDFWTFKSPEGRTPRQSVDFMYPYLADKEKWLADGRPKDVMHWDNWPVRQPCLLFAYAEFGDSRYFDLWKKLDPDPTDLEIRRNMAVTQPLLWIADPDQIPILKPAVHN
jgi:hypothetical protein